MAPGREGTVGWEGEGSREARREVTTTAQDRRGGAGETAHCPLSLHSLPAPQRRRTGKPRRFQTHTHSHTLSIQIDPAHTHAFYIHRDFTPAFHTHIHIFYIHIDFIRIHTHAHILTFIKNFHVYTHIYSTHL